MPNGALRSSPLHASRPGLAAVHAVFADTLPDKFNGMPLTGLTLAFPKSPTVFAASRLNFSGDGSLGQPQPDRDDARTGA